MASPPTLAQRLRAALGWISAFSLPGGGISVSSENSAPYPEVTGYFIPTLVNWGMRDVARRCATWLCSIQKSDGSWHDPSDSAPYVFDTAQILKGLLCLAEGMPELESAVVKGCDWLVGNIDGEGRLSTPTQDAWGEPGVCSDLVHLYCLSPLIEAGKRFGRDIYADKAGQVLTRYKSERLDDILDFNILSHFYAYVVEGLIDIGERELAGRAMDKVSLLQKADGSIPAYKHGGWVCSVGLFQFALAYYKLGMKERGDRAFRYAASLQNPSGGWFGGYPRNGFPAGHRPDYFPRAEISWAVKYFLDAFQYKLLTDFEQMAPIFLDEIAPSDGRYRLVRNAVEEKGARRILDAGCGKGRYLRNLSREFPGLEWHGVDLSREVMQSIPAEISRKQGSLLNLPYPDGHFDLVFSCEALEHAVHTDAALAECARVVKNGGWLLIIDKNREKQGALRIAEWEQWFDIAEIAAKLSALGFDVDTFDNVPYENKSDGLFCAWMGCKQRPAASVSKPMESVRPNAPSPAPGAEQRPYLTFDPRVFLGDSPALALYAALAEARLNGDAEFEKNLYAKFLSHFPGERHEHSAEIFFRLIDSIARNGFDFMRPVSAWPAAFAFSNGAHRMAASIALGIREIPYLHVPFNNQPARDKYREIFSPEEYRWLMARQKQLIGSLDREQRLLCRMRMFINSDPQPFGNAPFSSQAALKGCLLPYQGLKSIGLTGKREAEKRFALYRLDQYLTGSMEVLETGCNCGFLSWLVARRTKRVEAFDAKPAYIRLGSMLKEEYGTDNLEYVIARFEDFTPSGSYDAIISCALHGWVPLPFAAFVERLDPWLKPGGILLFESHELPVHPEWKEQRALLTDRYDLLYANYIDDVDHSLYVSEYREFLILKKR